MRKTLALGCALLALLASRAAWSDRDGRAGASGESGSCNSCHNGGTPPSFIEFVGPNALDAGTTATYTLRFLTDAAVTGCGVGVGDTAATLAGDGDGGTKTKGFDVTHIRPTAPVAGEARYTFTLTAPPYGGPLTLYGAGNACNGDDTRDGDRAALTTLSIAVSGPPKPVPEGGPLADADAIDGSAAGPGASRGFWSTECAGCDVAPGGGAGAAALVGLAAFLVARRRPRRRR
jgi:hypothetical protein